MAKVKIRTYSKAKRLVNERRRQITKGALQLFLENGYHQTSVRRIAEACGMSLGSIYHYIGSKEDILYLFIGEATTRSIATMRQLSECTEPIRALTQAIDKWYHLTDELQGEILFSYQEIRNLKPEMRAYLLENNIRIADIFEKILLEGINQGTFHVEDAKLVAHSILFLGHMWALRRWFLRKHYTLEQYIRLQTQLILAEVGAVETQEVDTVGKVNWTNPSPVSVKEA